MNTKRIITGMLVAVLAGILCSACSNDTPDIVKQQQKREQKRQNTTWTPENQRKHPIEYCQAMLEELSEKEKDIEAVQDKVLIAESALRREATGFEADKKTYGAFLEKAKVAYGEAEAQGTWPTTFNKRVLSQDEFKAKIVDGHNKLKGAEGKLEKIQEKLAALEKRKVVISQQQEQMLELRGQFEGLIRDVELKMLTDENGDLGKSLGKLGDSIVALNQSSAVLSDEEFFDVSSREEKLNADFEAIMSE